MAKIRAVTIPSTKGKRNALGWSA